MVPTYTFRRMRMSKNLNSMHVEGHGNKLSFKTSPVILTAKYYYEYF